MSTIKATNFQHANASDPALVLAADGTATANVSAINGGPLAGMRNAIINGNFDIWQRGTSQTATGYGSADRWIVGASGGSSFSLARQSFTLGQTDVPDNPTYFARLSVTTAPTSGNVNLTQWIEDVRTFAGQQITLSFWAKADATKTVWVGHSQRFGTGGSPSAESFTNGQLITLSTSWAKYTITTTLPSVSGKTLGTSSTDAVRLLIIVSNDQGGFHWSSIPSQTITFDIAQVQIEAGPVATPFERRPIGTELALCQRYFCVLDSVLLRNTSTNFFVTANVSYPVIMRRAPTSTHTFSVSGAAVADTDSIATTGRTGIARVQCRFTTVTTTGGGTFTDIRLDAEL